VNFNVAEAISPMTPTVTGGVPTAYTVAPPLPAGLAINGTTGVITGTPTTVQPSTNYVFTASNGGGSASATIAILVRDLRPVISYPNNQYTFTVGVAVEVAPNPGTGAVDTWSINPAVPPDLTFNATTGRIAGTPRLASAAQPYVITATNAFGSGTFNLTLAVQTGGPPGAQPGVLLELGHATNVIRILHDGSRILSADESGHVSLWNAQSGALLASTGSACAPGNPRECGFIALAGPTAAVRQLTGIDVFSSVDGSLIAQVPAAEPFYRWWALSDDGEYLVVPGTTGLTVWSRAGSILFTLAGNYGGAAVYAAAGEFHIAKGAADPAVIETVTVPGGISTVGPEFQGTFHSWFSDGGRFLTNVGNTVWVYSTAGLQQDLVALPTIERLGGHGNWFWTGQNALNIYSVGASTAPAASFSKSPSQELTPSANTIAFGPPGTQLSIVDLSGAAPVKRDYTTPVDDFRAYGAASATDWAYAPRYGALFGELSNASSPPPMPQRYAPGRAFSIAGSDSRIAIATASGQIFHFDTATHSLQSEIAYPSTQVALSTDGTQLVAAGDVNNGQPPQMRVYAMPGETSLADFPNTFQQDMTFATGGNVIGRIVYPRTRQVIGFDGIPIWSDIPQYFYPEISAVRLSPNGSRFAVAVPVDDFGERSSTTGTNVYNGATLTTAVLGIPVGWIDNDRLMVNRYTRELNFGVYNRCEFVSPTGQVTTCPALPHIKRMQTLTSNSIYSPEHNKIFDLTTGATLWSSSAAIQGEGAVAGNHVVFASGATVRFEAR
jgi:WD40 repeat protein